MRSDPDLQADYDVIVIGGGPAGSTTAALVAEAGRRTLVLERDRFPRYSIGESMMPATYWTLKRIGVLERMKRSEFPRKHSVQFFAGNGKASRPYYFEEIDPHESSWTWQVLRSEFDTMLLDNAAEKGAEVRQGVAVRDVLFDGDRAVGVVAELPGGQRQRIGARVVADASGQRSLLSRRFRLLEADRNLLHAAFFTQYEGAWRGEGIDAGATLIMHTEHERSWFWYIPLKDGRVSVGVVGPIDYLVRGRSSDPSEVFQEEAAACPALLGRIETARQVMDVRVLRDFSYCARRVAGDGWVLVGDAFGFIDPIYSSGLFLALKGGEMTADSILDALAAGDVSGERLGRHGAEFVRGIEALRKMVYAFYEPRFSFGGFLKAHPECKEDLVHLLIGNVFRVPMDRLMRSMDAFCKLPDYRPLRMADAGVATASGDAGVAASESAGATARSDDAAGATANGSADGMPVDEAGAAAASGGRPEKVL